jgi:TatA/E family protein of Tat protein translocase
MGPLGFPELVIIFIVALVVFGPRKLPELGRSLGKGLSEFKRASNELRSTLDEEIRSEDRKVAAPRPELGAPSHAVIEPEVMAASEHETVARGEDHS